MMFLLPHLGLGVSASVFPSLPHLVCLLSALQKMPELCLWFFLVVASWVVSSTVPGQLISEKTSTKIHDTVM